MSKEYPQNHLAYYFDFVTYSLKFGIYLKMCSVKHRIHCLLFSPLCRHGIFAK